MRRLVVVLAALAIPASIRAQSPGTTTVPVTSVASGMKPGHTALLLGGALVFASFLDDALNEEMQAWRSPATNSLARIGNKFGTEEPGLDCFNATAPNFSPSASLVDGAVAPPNDGFFDSTATYMGAFKDAAARPRSRASARSRPGLVPRKNRVHRARLAR